MSINNQIPKSRVNITYEMEVDGIKKPKELPFKQLVIGDFSQGSSKEKSLELPNRKIYEIESNNLDSIMREMDIKLDINVENHVNLSGGVLNLKFPINSIKSFNPNTIANSIPELQKLIKIKELLKEYVSLIDNNRKFRNMVNNALEASSELESIKKQLGLDSDDKGYKLESNKEKVQKESNDE